MNIVKRKAAAVPKRGELEFDVTQEIDPALADPLRASSEPTLTASDFDVDSMLDPPPHPAPRRR